MGCGSKCVKISLIMFNVFFWLLGLAILAVGIWIKVDQRVVNLSEAIKVGNEEPIVEVVTWIFIGTGIFVFCVGFFGCCGAIRESKVLLGFYMTCIVLVFAAEIGAGVYAWVKRDQIEQDIRQHGAQWIKTYYDDKNTTSLGLNYLQLTFCCCGVNDFYDYKGSQFVIQDDALKNGYYMSYACCKPVDSVQPSTVKVEISIDGKQECMSDALRLGQLYDNQTKTELNTNCESAFRAKGCLTEVVEWAKSHLIILIIVGLVIGVLQLFGFVLACCLCRMISMDEKI